MFDASDGCRYSFVVANTYFVMYMTRKLTVLIRYFLSFLGTTRLNLQVVIWSKSYCGYCFRTKKVFQQGPFKNVDVKVHEIDSLHGREIQATLAQMTGQRTVPMVFINGKLLGGDSDTQAAYRQGRLQEMLGV